jgi:hypothetical protein
MSPYRALHTLDEDEQRRELAAFVGELRKMKGLPTERGELVRDAVVHALQTCAFFYLASTLVMSAILWIPFCAGIISLLRLGGDIVALCRSKTT